MLMTLYWFACVAFFSAAITWVYALQKFGYNYDDDCDYDEEYDYEFGYDTDYDDEED